MRPRMRRGSYPLCVGGLARPRSRVAQKRSNPRDECLIHNQVLCVVIVLTSCQHVFAISLVRSQRTAVGASISYLRQILMMR